MTTLLHWLPLWGWACVIAVVLIAAAGKGNPHD